MYDVHADYTLHDEIMRNGFTICYRPAREDQYRMLSMLPDTLQVLRGLTMNPRWNKLLVYFLPSTVTTIFVWAASLGGHKKLVKAMLSSWIVTHSKYLGNARLMNGVNFRFAVHAAKKVSKTVRVWLATGGHEMCFDMRNLARTK